MRATSPITGVYSGLPALGTNVYPGLPALGTKVYPGLAAPVARAYTFRCALGGWWVCFKLGIFTNQQFFWTSCMVKCQSANDKK